MRPSFLPRLAAVVLVTAAAPAPAHAADAVFGGSSRGATIVVKTDAAATTLRSIGISWVATCTDGTSFPSGGMLTPVMASPGFAPGSDELLMARNGKGRFTGTQLAANGNAAIVVDVDGKLKAGTARGTLRATVKILDPATGDTTTTCTTSQSWVSTRKAGIVYGGSTSQDLPIVIRLNARRDRVEDLLTMWFARCTQGGYFAGPDHIGNFTVKSSGAFGNPFAFDTAMDAGGKRHFDYKVAGRVTRTATKGTLRTVVTDTDANGAPTDTCDSGSVTWKAATG